MLVCKIDDVCVLVLGTDKRAKDRSTWQPTMTLERKQIEIHTTAVARQVSGYRIRKDWNVKLNHCEQISRSPMISSCVYDTILFLPDVNRLKIHIHLSGVTKI